MKNTVIFLNCALIIAMSDICASMECITFAHDPSAEQNLKCDCPCRQYKMLPRGQCSYCGHYRYPSHWYIMKDKKRRAVKKKTIKNKQCQQPMTEQEKLNEVFGEYAHPNPDN